jgi:hypothetical protein
MRSKSQSPCQAHGGVKSLESRSDRADTFAAKIGKAKE